jgi:4'-phosphopantetheinyl transferase
MPVVSVDIRLAENVMWDNEVAGEIREDSLDLWRVQVSENDALNSDLFTLLDAHEKDRCHRFRRVEDKKRFICAHAALRTILSRYLNIHPAEMEFGESMPAGKPMLQGKGKERLQYNISHSGGWVMIAVSKHEVGIDVEFMNPSVEFRNIAPSVLSSVEMDFLKRSPDPEKTFYLLWTRKEALLKGSGKGLTDNLSDVPSLEGVHHVRPEDIGSVESWHICSFEPEEKHMASVAFYPDIKYIRYRNCVLGATNGMGW